ncbi:transcriptional regulator, LacI family [Aeromonas sp. RU39B]|jgi:LacI family purine nucleotide synthesis repressor|uniref:substrate-binding domain-containing protein n=1 Tax=Aeromonas sp. RU39B TaxID=1907416 RepID=UPI000956D7B0|nr:substrate-binding domain-containing protein [Aeromonas sp. RU39B]SIR26839.1 transcriptional regulator, LacI family [Aeromonas sp. RU39B]
MATIKDVAARAGVSISTVSHVLNHTRRVSEEATQKVVEAVAELNYAPNSVARSLKVNSTKTIGMLVTTSANPFFAEVVRGVEAYCFEQGYSLILCNTENQPQRQRHYLKMLMEKRVDGLLVLGTDIDSTLRDMLRSHQSVPLVMLDWGTECDFANVINDNARAGARMAARYLLDQGHTDIACITGQLDKQTTQQRIDGVRDALSERGLTLPEQRIFEGDFESQSGFDQMKQILALTPRPSAVFAFDDPMAIGAICAAWEAGVKVPDDISIIGYDDVEMARFASPPLTTIRHPKAELGQMAVQQLVGRIRNKEQSVESVTVQPELIIRHSVKKLN